MLADMRNLSFRPTFPKRSLLLWRAFWRALQPLRPACSRTACQRRSENGVNPPV